MNKQVWHYSNTKDLVVTVTVEDVRKHYSGTGYALFFGEIPQ